MTEWINVKDQLPIDDLYVLVLCEVFFIRNNPLLQKISNDIFCNKGLFLSFEIFEGFFTRSWGWEIPSCTDKDAHVKYWMPLPEMPKDIKRKESNSHLT